MSNSPVRSKAAWFLNGMRGIVSVPALILMTSFVGFAGLASGAGISLAQTLFMVAIVWALPSKVVLVGSIIAGSSLPATFIAVTLSAMRLMPMVAALVPEIRTKKTPTWLLLILSHFVAITAWVYTMQKIDTIPREGRIAYFAGMAGTLCVANIVIVAIVYNLVPELPTVVAAALFFLTPIYFLTSLWASARERVIHIAMVLGLFSAPVFHRISAEFDILYAGIIGGTVAFAIDRLWRRRTGRRP